MDVAVVRGMTTADVGFAAVLHHTALPHGFFARLGTSFLLTYYESFVASPHAVALVAQGASGPAGVLVGTVRTSQHYSWVLRRFGPRLAVRGLLALLRTPGLLLFFLRTRLGWYSAALLRVGRRWARRSRTGTNRGAREPAVLTHVAVTPFGRGTGTGAALVREFVDAASAAGCRQAVLVTLAGADGAGRFYQRLGWIRRDVHRDHDGRLVECYERRL
jgi:GNAT superfamily N-acetyltransferase